MTYDFDHLTERRDGDSEKWSPEYSRDLLPLWVADMDFEAPPAVRKALADRVAHGIFGYCHIPDNYYEAVSGWMRRDGLIAVNEEIITVPGVIPALSAILKALTLPGDQVIVQTPAYGGFFSSVRNSGCEIVPNPLVIKDGRYEIDFDDLEAKASAARARVMLICNPHNPTGRLWSRCELERLRDIAEKYQLYVISDEIHCDIRPEGTVFTPWLTLERTGGNSVTCRSASKTFNLAGLQNAWIVCPDASLRRRIDRAVNINEVCDVNPLGVAAVTAACREGGPWLQALNRYIRANYQLLKDFLAAHIQGIRVMPMESTYLAWLDCRELGLGSDELDRRLCNEAGIRLSAGTVFGAGGEGFMRLNLACPRQRLEQALGRLKTFTDGLKAAR